MRILSSDREKKLNEIRMNSAERVTLIRMRSNGAIPERNRAFPAVPEEAHISAAVMTHRYPLVVRGGFTLANL